MPDSILIVDDERAIRDVLKRFFLNKGLMAMAAENGRDAIESCNTTPVDVVILDLKLPDMHGLEVLKQIKSASPGAGVVILTAYGDVETAVKAMHMKADNFLLKPVDLEALVREEMAGAANLRLPLDVSVGVGRSWDDAAH